MIVAPIPGNENKRLNALEKFKVLDTNFEKEYDEIVNLASYICETPIALVSLVDSERQWFKAKVGLEVRETPRDIAFCSHTLESEEMLIVNDTFEDKRFHDNPLVTEDPNIRFYAGAQLKTADGYVLGTLCAIDRKPRNLSDNQLNALKILAKQVMTRLELQKSYLELGKYANYLNTQNDNNNKLFKIISHDLRSPFNSILGFAEIINEDLDSLTKYEIKNIAQNISSTSRNTFELVNNLLNWSVTKSKDNGKPKEQINLNSLLNKLLSVLRGLIIKKNINIFLDVMENLDIYSNYDYVFSILQNILSNSIKFTPHSGSIKIKIFSDRNNAIISIQDSGVGMSRAEIDNLISHDGNLSRTGTEGEKGIGVGFGIALDFITLLEGKFDIISNPGKGTVVKIMLPHNVVSNKNVINLEEQIF